MKGPVERWRQEGGMERAEDRIKKSTCGHKVPCIYQRLTVCMQLAAWGQEELC